MTLNEGYVFECQLGATRMSGTWKIGTYSSRAVPTGDVVLCVKLVVSQVPHSPWPQKPPFNLKFYVHGSAAEGPLDAFSEEHIRRRSGKNTLIEGQKEPAAAKL